MTPSADGFIGRNCPNSPCSPWKSYAAEHLTYTAQAPLAASSTSSPRARNRTHFCSGPAAVLKARQTTGCLRQESTGRGQGCSPQEFWAPTDTLWLLLTSVAP